MVDVSRKPGLEEKKAAAIISNQTVKTIIGLNKIDKGLKYLNDYISLWEAKTKTKGKNKKDPLVYYIPISAKTGKNIEQLRQALLENLPEGEPYYDKSFLTDFPDKFRVADIVREKLFLELDEELPHSLAVEVSEINNKRKLIDIKVNIYVKRNSQKKIVVGKKGAILKKVGSEARPEIEKIYKKKVFLDIWVTVLADWQERPRILKQLGYWWV